MRKLSLSPCQWRARPAATTTVGLSSGLITWREQVQEYGPLPIEPSAVALNYGQAIFEGLAAGPNRTTKPGAGSRALLCDFEHR